MTKLQPSATLCLLLVATCSGHRTGATSAPEPAASSPPPVRAPTTPPADRRAPQGEADSETVPASETPAADIDRGPLDAWYQSHAGRVVFRQSAPAEDLSFAIDLIDWVTHGDEQAFARMEPRIEAVWANPDDRVQLGRVFAHIDREASRRYHTAGLQVVGNLPREARDPEAEQRLFGKALLLDPTNPDLYNHMAIAAILRDDYLSGSRWARLAITIDPGFLNAYQELAYADKNLERYAAVIEVADRGLKVDGELRTKALLLARKGQAFWLMGREGDALDAFRKSKRIGGPTWVNSYLQGEQELGKRYREPAKK